MPPKRNCAECQKQIKDKHFLVCSNCKKPYDLSCAKKEKLFDLMDKHRKDTWTCNGCKRSKLPPKITSTPARGENSTATSDNKIKSTSKVPKSNLVEIASDNVTKRKYNVHVQNSFESLSDESEFESFNQQSDRYSE